MELQWVKTSTPQPDAYCQPPTGKTVSECTPVAGISTRNDYGAGEEAITYIFSSSDYTVDTANNRFVFNGVTRNNLLTGFYVLFS